jgi:uncharacterized membrane protein
MKVPHSPEWHALAALWPVFFSYVLSFAYLAIYWNNHHHMMHTVDRINGKILWANLHLLFWLSLVPFVTGWLGENNFVALPTAVYGGVLLGAAAAYRVLQQVIISDQGRDSKLAAAVGRDLKGKVSAGLYAIAIPIAFWNHWISLAIFVLVALMWLVPDPRIESRLR